MLTCKQKKMKYLLLLLFMCSCTVSRQKDVVSLKQELNDSVIDGFYDNDTTGMTGKIYLLKVEAKNCDNFAYIHFK